MSVIERARLRQYEPVCWNFALLAQHELDSQRMGEGMSVTAPDGRRIMWLRTRARRRILPRSMCRTEAEGRGADRPAAGTALELAGTWGT
jgi:hypothetical protein